MRESESVTGMVLLSAPSGEYDRRLVLLTRERGKITAFAHGARRPGSPLMAASRTFAFGVFFVYEGRTAYTLHGAQISEYFEELSLDVEAACFGSYFLEVAAFLSQENMDGSELLKLVYVSLKALGKPSIPNRLVQRVFELRALVIDGQYTQTPPEAVSEACAYAWEYVITAPVQRLYRFTLKEGPLKEFERAVEASRRRFIRHSFRSLEILESLKALSSPGGDTNS